MVKRLWQVLVSAAMVASACAANPGRSSMAVPLQIPEPPPRADIEPLTGPEPRAEAIPVPAARPTATIPAPATSSRPPAPAASPTPAPQPPVAQVPEPVAAAPPPELRPAGPAGQTPTGAQVREALGRAKQKLDLIDRRRLNSGKRADYDSARRFLEQAEGAVKVNNLMLAQSSAEKAETLADGLR
jgi:hypothetical protein